MEFEGKVVLITGGSRGIGRAIAQSFAEQGAKISIIDINQNTLDEVRRDFTNKGYEIFTKQVNVIDTEEVELVGKEIVSKFGTINILVNNAGIIRDNLLYKMTDDDWQQVIDVHLKGSFNVTRAIQKYMVKQNHGRIINISSTSALGNRGQANYATAKAGLQGFTKTLAIELGKYGITVNAVAPGFIETEMTKSTAKRIGLDYNKLVELNVSKIPVARSGKPEDIANAVLFFAEEAASFVNGQVIYIAGGPKD